MSNDAPIRGATPWEIDRQGDFGVVLQFFFDLSGPRPTREPTQGFESATRLYRIIKTPPTESRSKDGWTFAITKPFSKSISSLEKALQARVLEAILVLRDAPVELRGDTVKPLEGSLKGLWRYRIGAYRLIYEPNIEAHQIVLVDICARSEAYQ